MPVTCLGLQELALGDFAPTSTKTPTGSTREIKQMEPCVRRRTDSGQRHPRSSTASKRQRGIDGQACIAGKSVGRRPPVRFFSIWTAWAEACWSARRSRRRSLQCARVAAPQRRCATRGIQRCRARCDGAFSRDGKERSGTGGVCSGRWGCARRMSTVPRTRATGATLRRRAGDDRTRS